MKQVFAGTLTVLIVMCFASEGSALQYASSVPTFASAPPPGIVMIDTEQEIDHERLVAKRGGKKGKKKAKKAKGKDDTEAEQAKERGEREKERAEKGTDKAERGKDMAESGEDAEKEGGVRAAGKERKRTDKESKLRGLDRADEAAGEHGAHGRAKARSKGKR